MPAHWLPTPEQRRVVLPIAVIASIGLLLIGLLVGRLIPSADNLVDSSAPDGHQHQHGTTDDGGTAGIDGLGLSSAGYQLNPMKTQFNVRATAQRLSFTIDDPRGKAVTAFDTVHDKKMHLFVVRSDMSGYQHVHPVFDEATAQWNAVVAFDKPGGWRMIADFTMSNGAGGTSMTLARSLDVAGDWEPSDIPPQSLSTTVAEFKVDLEADFATGPVFPLLITVTRDGSPVELEPYLGAFGHLVVLRHGDMGFLHVHPDAELYNGALRFWTALPSSGSYALFLDFSVDGVVHTAQFTATV